MKYLLLMKYGPSETCSVPMTEWDPEDVKAHTTSSTGWAAS